jgi:hypothetical protein
MATRSSNDTSGPTSSNDTSGQKFADIIHNGIMDPALRNPFDYKPRFQRDDEAPLQEESAPMGKY